MTEAQIEEYNFWKYLGYPECCIIHFINNPRIITKLQDKVHKQEGFIPCSKCTSKILDRKRKLEDLIIGRKHFQKFPLDDKVPMSYDSINDMYHFIS